MLWQVVIFGSRKKSQISFSSTGGFVVGFVTGVVGDLVLDFVGDHVGGCVGGLVGGFNGGKDGECIGVDVLLQSKKVTFITLHPLLSLVHALSE
jgi:hypothetical protein